MDAPFGAWRIAGTYTWLVLDARTWRCVAGPYQLRREANAEAERRNNSEVLLRDTRRAVALHEVVAVDALLDDDRHPIERTDHAAVHPCR